MAKKRRLIRKIILGIAGVIIFFILIVIDNLIIMNKNESIISLGKPIGNYGKERNALLIIDVQEATTGEVSMYPFFKQHSDLFIRNINRIAESFKTQDLPVVYVRSEITNPVINLLNDSYAKGHPGARNDKRLKVVSDLEVVKNGQDSFRNTILDSILTGNKVTGLYIVGLDAAECVNATVKAAQNRNYKVSLIDEAIMSKSEVRKDSMMLNFRERGARIISMDSLNILKW
jgi:nicotinamidase/pyrazinamidase